MCPLLGLAPGGVYHASPVTSAAVGSYPTLSPLPSGRSLRAVSFLWHFPSAHAGRPLAVALSTWSPDFPPVWGYPHTSGCPAIWSGGGYRGVGGEAQMGGGFRASRGPHLPPPLAAGPSSPASGRGVALRLPWSQTQEGTTPLRTSCLPVCFESVYRDTVLALDFGLRSTSGSGDKSVRADFLSSPSGPGRSPFQAHDFRVRRHAHNRGVACTRLTACVCHCWHSRLGHRLRIAPRYGIRPRLAGSSSRLPAIACFDPVISAWPFAPPVSRLCS